MKNLILTCTGLLIAGYLYSQRPNFSDPGTCIRHGRFNGFSTAGGTITVLCGNEPDLCCVKVIGGVGGGFHRIAIPDINEGKYKHFIVKDQILSESEIILDDKKVNVYTFELLTQ